MQHVEPEKGHEKMFELVKSALRVELTLSSNIKKTESRETCEVRYTMIVDYRL